MQKLKMFMALLMVLTALAACSPVATVQTITPTSTPQPTTTEVASLKAHLTPNPVETSMPIYGGTLLKGYQISTIFDSHEYATGWTPEATLPIFNQLVMFDINYKECVPENIIGDLADSWETSDNGTEITFHLHHGVKWQDGVPFTSDDVVYSLDKMTDFNRSVITAWFPAYQRTEKIDDYTVIVHLKYPSASFMLALAQGEAQIQSYHLWNANPKSIDFLVGTGPFIATEYVPQVDLKYKRNPDYWKKDKYGNQLPYLDGIIMYHGGGSAIEGMVVTRRLDLKSLVTGTTVIDNYNSMKQAAPDLLWQKRTRESGAVIFLNTAHKPLDDIRVRQALGLVINETDLIIGYSGDESLGLPGQGILSPSYGLPKEEVSKLMGWDKPMEERVTEAQKLMADAGYPNGFKMKMITGGTGYGGASAAAMVYIAVLKKDFNIDVEAIGTTTPDVQQKLKDDNYDMYILLITDVTFDPSGLATYFETGEHGNYSHYSNPELDKKFAELDRIIDPSKRQEAIWEIERTLLTDLPVLPTGCFVTNFMPYYPWVKNIRFTNMSFSNINRLEDVWLDESLKPK